MVLIIDSDKKSGRTVADMMYYMGVLSCVTDAREALSELTPAYRAALVTNPNRLASPEELISRLRSLCNIPIFSISDSVDDNPCPEIFDGNFPFDIASSGLIYEMAKYTEQRLLPTVGVYELAGIDASCGSANVTCLGEPMGLTRTETMILRYLIRSYPQPKSASDILRFAYRRSRTPELSGIRTHICGLNKKFKRLKGRSLIQSVPEKGYVVLTPELILTGAAL